jgi:[ribosomal protein S18]-alanine N-acetyltransferase
MYKLLDTCRRSTQGDRPEIAEARPGELRALVALDRACFPEVAWPPSAWWQALLEPDFRVRVVRQAGVVVAASVVLLGRPVAVLASLGVHPSLRGRGIGRRLIVDAVLAAFAAKARWMSLDVDRVNHPAISLYRACGFVAVRRFSEDGRARQEMLRRLGRGRSRIRLRPAVSP